MFIYDNFWVIIINKSSFLFLLPPSCMVAPIGKLANKFSFSSNNFSTSTTASNTKSPLLAMSITNNIGMDIQTG